tara:strand:+ start:571 stop:1107 length:537 start_codon:yes stop_codon:yes gene_type:complete
MAINFADGSTQNHGSKIVQVKHFVSAAQVRTNGSGYLMGSGSSGYSFTMKNTSNKFLLVCNFSFGFSNINGGLKILINGGESSQYFNVDCTTASSGGSNAYTGAFNTANDGPYGTSDYVICPTAVSFLSTGTMPSSAFYIGLYHYTNDNGYANLNRQHNDTQSNAVSSMTAYEIEDIS